MNNNELYLQLLLWWLSSTEKNNLVDLLQHPVVSIIIIAIRLPIDSPNDIVSIVSFSQRRHHIIHLHNRLLAVSVESSSSIHH